MTEQLHSITAHLECIDNMINYFTYDVRNNPQPDKTFLNFDNNNLLLRSKWKSELLDKMNLADDINRYYTPLVNSADTRLFADEFSNQICSRIEPLFVQKYEHDTSPLKGKFDKDPIFVEKRIIDNVDAKVYIVGDIHGSFHAMYYVLTNMNIFKEDTWELRDNTHLVFLGDIVDYSYFALECIALAFLIYIKNPEHVTIINGNHEDASIYSLPHFTFKKEMDAQLSQEQVIKWTKILHYLPSAVYLTYNSKTYHLSHGAFDSAFCMIHNNEEKSALKIFLESDNMFQLVSPFTSQLILNQYKWGDFHQSENYTKPFRTDIGRHIFSQFAVNNYLKDNNIECILSGHQDNIPLGLLCNDDDKFDLSVQPKKPTAKIIDTYNFALEKNIPRYQDGYDLYVPEKIYNTDANCDAIDTIKLKPKTDFIALVTSTAIQSKDVAKLCYLMLSVDQNIVTSPASSSSDITDGAQEAGSNMNYKQLYYKYKVKYLQLKDKIEGKN